MLTTEIDPATGFPALPEGYFYSVKLFSRKLNYRYEVQIRKGRSVFSYTFAYDLARDRKAIPGSAMNAYNKFRERIHADREDQSILGDYPPKKWSN